MKRLVIVKDQRFGLLTVVEELPYHRKPGGQIVRKFLCRCDCGKSTSVRIAKLTGGHTKSCGCLRRYSKNTNNWYSHVVEEEDGTKKSKEELLSRDKVRVRCGNCSRTTHMVVSGLKASGEYRVCRFCCKRKSCAAARESRIVERLEDLTEDTRRDIRNIRDVDAVVAICNKCGKECQRTFVLFKVKVKGGIPFTCGSCNSRSAALNPKAKKKREETLLRRYNVAHPSQMPDHREKTDSTNLKRYGTTNTSATDEVRDLKIKNSMRRYGVPHSSQRGVPSESINTLSNKSMMYELHITKKQTLACIGKELRVDPSTVHRYLVKLGIPINLYRSNTSAQEKDLGAMVESLYTGEILYNTRNIIRPKELDIYIPDKKLAIEFNGLYWHTEQFIKAGHHSTKMKLCLELGITLLSVWEDDWTKKNSVVENKIVHLLRNGADREYTRNTMVSDVRTLDKDKFYRKYHIQNSCASSTNLGLFHGGRLIACMSFVEKKDKVWELVRYATSMNVVADFRKLLNHFKKTYDWEKIISFEDPAWPNGDLYKKADWTCGKLREPDYKYAVHGVREHKSRFYHRSLKGKLKTYDSNISEHQNMLNNGIYRIYDYGRIRYIQSNAVVSG